ncbi:type II secretion system F family protein [Methanococcoides burtonii]|uniref:Type II secretion system protein F domain n=1 Tax=Methanococcoides burtonii (strain DSM 6242 / NBRC 107633 / OCM 468 / ACE-M) TaxID=259564 RepID=Q12Z66_METBU|nr:type II secretion system F family protein [Methanococcoides burtonii]ABE51260.1 type II secretion system protein F domain [Methanococcoides burtonii DSM 6242]
MDKYFSIAFALFGKYYVDKRSKYFNLRRDLLRSRLNMGYDRYLSGVLLISILATLGILLLFFFVIVLIGVPVIEANRFGFPAWTAAYRPYQPILVAVFGGLFFAALCFVSVYSLLKSYPAMVAGDRKRKIEQMLPYAINYMSAMSGAGVLPVDLFRALSNNEIYGEMCVESKYLVRDLEVLGSNLVSAMKNLASSTPSPMLQEFLQGAITVVTSGGELESYFKIKAEQYIIDNRQKQKEFLETLGLLGETYVTAFVAGPLFLIITIAIVSLMGGADQVFLYILVYGLIPVGSAMFLVIITLITPEE